MAQSTVTYILYEVLHMYEVYMKLSIARKKKLNLCFIIVISYNVMMLDYVLCQATRYDYIHWQYALL